MSTKQKLPRFSTPAGKARFPKLIEPDEYKGKKAYKVDLVLTASEAQELATKLQPVFDEFIKLHTQELTDKLAEASNAKAKKDAEAALAKFQADPQRAFCEEEYDADGELTGNMVFKFKTNHSYQNKQGETIIRKVKFFDAEPKQVYPEAVGGGSTLKVNFTPSPYHLGGAKGLSLKINAVQIIELSSFGEVSAEDCGFGAEEGGYSGSTEEVSPSEPVTVPEADDGNPDF